MPKKFYTNDFQLKAAVDRALAAGSEATFPIRKGLSCIVTDTGRARFVHRFPWAGGYPTIWLDGDYPADVSITKATDWCEANEVLLADGVDPRVARDTGAAANPTLAEYCRTHYNRLAPFADRVDYGVDKSRWMADLTKHTASLSRMKIDAIRDEHVRAVLGRYWVDGKPRPTGRRIADQLAKVLKHRHKLQARNMPYWQNPADFETLCFFLGDEKHYGKRRPALAFELAPAFVCELRQIESMAARCLEWVILTGCRAKEGTGAKWGELDLGKRTWTIPASRLKSERRKGEAGEPFVIPLSYSMCRVLQRVRQHRQGLDLGPDDYIFPSYGKARSRAGARKAGIVGRKLSNQALLFVVKTINPAVTTHGFRATFVAWGKTVPHRARPKFPLVVMDRAIGHMIGARTAAEENEHRLSQALGNYLRGCPYLDERKFVMREWSAYLNGTALYEPPPAEVAPAPEPASNVAAFPTGTARRAA